ncbi:zinc finger, CCHC-type containing protein [Tanacetum coccineum]|uniref:Zinc finger, CCHC-type containing protein n=1 Tax=Tanacetum coccineum TaxID=301880 RepID=A0ABQ4WXW0_9ASTR
MTTLADKAILSGADNRPPMLEKDMYDSWKSIMELYMMNRQHGRMILESVENGPLIWPSIEENGVTRPKKYSELSPTEAIQADCDIKATNIILQGLPPEVYALVSNHKVAKELWERIQLLMQGTSLTKQERECKLYDEFDKFAYKKGESLREFYLRFSLLLNDMNIYNMKLEQFQVNIKFLNTLPSEWSKFMTDVKLVRDLHTKNIDQLHAFLEQHEFHANEKGDDPIDAINHMMSFLTAVVTSRYPTTNNQLRNSSNPRQQATINNGRVTLQPIQGRQTSVAAGTSRTYTPGSSGNNSGKQITVICYNCKGEGHMSKQCNKPKRKREAVADLCIGDAVGAPTEDGIGMGVEVATSDIREDEEEFEAEASAGDTMEITIDPLVTSAHYMSEVPLDRITKFKTAQRQFEAGQLMASGEKAGLTDRTRRLGWENLRVRALLCIKRDQVDSLRHHMALLQEEFCQICRDHDDALRRLRILESFLIAQRVAEVLANYKETRAANAFEAKSQSQNGNDNKNGNGRNGNGNHRDRGNNRNGNPNENGRGAMSVAGVCTYQDFVKCQPLNFKGTKGMVGQLELMLRCYDMERSYEVDDRSNNDLAAYTQRFQELTLLCTRMVPREEDQIERYVGGLPDNIQGNVMSTEPTRHQNAIQLSNSLMDQKWKGCAIRSIENKRKFESNQRDNHAQQPPFKRQNVGGSNVARAYTTGGNEGRVYVGPHPLCNKQGHFKKDFPKLKNQNHGNKPVIPEARGKAYTIGGGDANPGSNVVTGKSYPTNDSEDLGKLQPTADIRIFVGYAPSQKGPTPTFLMPGQISSGLVPNLVPATPYVPPTNKELEILFQLIFDEYLEPTHVKRLISPAPAVSYLVTSAGTPSSTTIDQDAPSPSHSPSYSALQSPSLHQGVTAESTLMENNPFAPVDNDLFVNVFALEPSFKASSSGDLSSVESPYVTQTLQHLGK